MITIFDPLWFPGNVSASLIHSRCDEINGKKRPLTVLKTVAFSCLMFYINPLF